MSRRYRNPIDRAAKDYGWDGSNDGYEYSGPKLRRNTVDGKLGGVCAGIADYLGWDQTMVRILTILLFIFTAIPMIAYPILWVFMPKDPRAPYVREDREQRDTKTDQKAKVRPTASSTTYTDVRSKFRSLELRLQDLERSITSKEWKLNRDFRDLEK